MRRAFFIGHSGVIAGHGPSPGRQASVSGGSRVRETDPVGGPMAGNFLSSARTRRPMSIYGTEGVASRLSVRQIATGEQAQAHQKGESCGEEALSRAYSMLERFLRGAVA